MQPPFLQDAGEEEFPAALPPVVDRADEIPEHYWAPRGAGFTRRAVAYAVDAAVLAALLGLFLAGGAVGLLRAGVDPSGLMSPAGLRAALVPFTLLAALLSLVYHVPFDALTGRTPGRRLAGLEVRSPDGSAPTWGAAGLRWCGATLALACGGIGIAWALFEPRRRGWADLLSNTVVAGRAARDAVREG